MSARENAQSVPFGALVYEPANNIFTRPNDTIYVYREPQTFVALGASGQQGQLNFDAWRISAAEAVGKAGGLNDTLADPAAVFLYRGETRETAQRLGLDIRRFEGPIIPVVYNFNFRDPAGYFLATKFQMRNKDVIFTSNAVAVEQAKVMNYIRLITATVNDPLVAAENAIILRNTLLRGRGDDLNGILGGRIALGDVDAFDVVLNSHWLQSDNAQTPPPTNRISTIILFVVVAAAPLPFGSVEPPAIAFWCIVLGIAVIRPRREASPPACSAGCFGCARNVGLRVSPS